MYIDDQIKTLQATIKALRTLHAKLVDDSSLCKTISVIGENAAQVNVPAMHLLSGIRQLEVARASLARIAPRATLDGPVMFTCGPGHVRSPEV